MDFTRFPSAFSTFAYVKYTPKIEFRNASLVFWIGAAQRLFKITEINVACWLNKNRQEGNVKNKEE